MNTQTHCQDVVQLGNKNGCGLHRHLLNYSNLIKHIINNIDDRIFIDPVHCFIDLVREKGSVVERRNSVIHTLFGCGGR